MRNLSFYKLVFARFCTPALLVTVPVVATAGLVTTTAGCAGQSAATVLSEVETGISDAEIAIQTIVAGIDAYFAAHPNVALQGQIDAAVADTTSALRVVNTTLAGATSLADSNVQAALASFASAYATLMQLVAQIGIQTSPTALSAAAVRGPNGVVYVAPPRILSKLTPIATKPVAPVAPPALKN